VIAEVTTPIKTCRGAANIMAAGVLRQATLILTRTARNSYGCRKTRYNNGYLHVG
jgi:hypothetical protein